MNILNIIDEIESVDGKVSNTSNSRRAAVKDFFSFGKKVAAAAVPLGLGSMFTASAQTSSDVTAVLQYVLALKHMEADLLTKGLATVKFDGKTNTLGADKQAIELMLKQDKLHIKYLQTAIGTAAVKAQTNYDFTANGLFKDVLTSDNTFFKVIQGIKDTTIRAIKGAAGSLQKQEALTAALSIHSVEARHSAKLRLLRYLNGYSPLTKPWLSETDQTAGAIGEANYAGEDNVMQGGKTVTGINGTSVTAVQATEAFDEPLTKAQVAAALAPFKITL
jgi:hypothetical protein